MLRQYNMFQSPFQIVHIYQVLWSEYFFKKIGAHFNLISIFLTLKHFFQKTYKNTYCFYEIFSKFLSRSTRSQNCHLKFLLKKKCGSFKMLTIYCSFLQLWATFVAKLMKISTIFISYFQSSSQVIHNHKLFLSENFEKENIDSSKY